MQWFISCKSFTIISGLLYSEHQTSISGLKNSFFFNFNFKLETKSPNYEETGWKELVLRTGYDISKKISEITLLSKFRNFGTIFKFY